MRVNDLEQIKKDISEGKIDHAIQTLNNYILKGVSLNTEKSEIYYLLGNAYRKKGVFSEALNNYRKAVEIDPDSPAAEASQALQNIFNFYNKDMYNH